VKGGRNQKERKDIRDGGWKNEGGAGGMKMRYRGGVKERGSKVARGGERAVKMRGGRSGVEMKKRLWKGWGKRRRKKGRRVETRGEGGGEAGER